MMKVWVLLLLVTVASAKTFTHCELARILKESWMSSYAGLNLANWVCLANAESEYKTNAINHNKDGSTDYGIFQINNRWWCSDGQFSSHNGCQISCSQLMTDNISDAIQCAKTIVSQQGISAWVGWNNHCKNKDVSQYIADCEV
ncbi:lysozyme C-like [Hoplias malabaricus]|uniref:lysozyme C-like n=1 Tax=Hoplias malabaricus TaxID=27720 RepID=UPI00346273E0